MKKAEEKIYRSLLALFKQEEGIKMPPIKFIKSVAQEIAYHKKIVEEYREALMEKINNDIQEEKK
jgi:hypothetical protein